MSREVRLQIGVQEITVRSDEDTAYLESLAAFVAERMGEVGKGQEATTTLSLALTAALSIADELHKFESANEGIDSALDGVSKDIESSLRVGQS